MSSDTEYVSVFSAALMMVKKSISTEELISYLQARTASWNNHPFDFSKLNFALMDLIENEDYRNIHRQLLFLLDKSIELWLDNRS